MLKSQSITCKVRVFLRVINSFLHSFPIGIVMASMELSFVIGLLCNKSDAECFASASQYFLHSNPISQAYLIGEGPMFKKGEVM